MKTDHQLQHDVIAELDWDASVQANRVGVEASDGVVTLTGHVESYAQKWAAERAAQRVAGVKAVAVELDVVLAGSSIRTDADIAKAALMAIDWNASIGKDTVKVRVEDGFVTLTGEVDWAYVRDAATACVRNLTGVRGVINDVRIRAVPTPHDLKVKIESALQRQAHRDAKAIDVAVKDGTITLSGVVDSWAERSTIERAAWNTPGVQRVVDKIVLA